MNVADNHHRVIEIPSERTTRLDVTIDEVTGYITMRNNGRTIDAVYHKEAGMYCPELVFGSFQAGSNFNDNEKRITGGRNGIGAKAANVLSREFSIHINDTHANIFYHQTWRDRMAVCQPPETSEAQDTEEYTQVSFLPDYAYFYMEGLDSDHFALFCRRVHDIAGCCPDLRVSLNGRPIAIHNFEAYIEARYPPPEPKPPADTEDDEQDDDGEPQKRFHYVELVDDENHYPWNIGVGMGWPGDGLDLSFVNAINTTDHGAHFTAIQRQAVRAVQEYCARVEHTHIPDSFIKDRLRVFVNALIVNPEFNSQCKSKLSHPSIAKLTNIAKLPEEFLQTICTSEVTDRILTCWRERMIGGPETTGAPKKKRPTGGKLEDAHKAGTEESLDCTLILTEGDSAKSLAVAGLSVVGRKHYGVLPLSGKVMNISKQRTSGARNAVLLQLENIMGLDRDKTYESEQDMASLRYGSIALMCDQDPDGSHIKGLLINWIHDLWPHLLKTDILPPSGNPTPFLKQIVTPLIKASKKGAKGINEQWFFSMQEFNQWYEDGNGSGWAVKYYKGLGSSTSAEGKEYFRKLEDDQRPLLIDFENLTPSDTDALKLAFTDTAGHRKYWLNSDAIGGALDTTPGSVSIEEFVNTDVASYFKYSNERAIPSCIDGLKPSQRKVLYTCFEKKLYRTKEMKVAQLGGAVAERTCYHHGEMSLHLTTIKLAQDYTGSGNNVPLLEPLGQFGTRLDSGADHASPRYISTRLSPLSLCIFHPDDMALLDYREEEDREIEPVCFVPIIPMILVNGAIGIGTGWSLNVPSFDPLAVVLHLWKFITRPDLLEESRKNMTRRHELVSSLRELEALKKNLLATDPRMTEIRKGILDFKKEVKKCMTQLRPWYANHTKPLCEDYYTEGSFELVTAKSLVITELPVGMSTEHAKGMLDDRIKKGLIKDYISACTDIDIHFTVNFNPSKAAVVQASLAKALRKKVQFNCWLHSADYSTINEFLDPEEVIINFFGVRIDLYVKRRELLISQVSQILSEKQEFQRFCKAFSGGTVRIDDEPETIAGVCGLSVAKVESHLSSATIKKIRNIAKRDDEIRKLTEEKEDLEAMSASEIWQEDLISFIVTYLDRQEFQTRMEALSNVADQTDRDIIEDFTRVIKAKLPFSNYSCAIAA
eukprot:TRINITY_DN1009_c3_g2_i2.p1 TRINITY_DN1009_c3_g2~~TRINITY_DN1009_c3_g2_i2.p1  ORF type:complete len:1162 (+),score=354.72 TRINITY_DN1009_c3_g2_i2:219-3704(+)